MNELICCLIFSMDFQIIFKQFPIYFHDSVPLNWAVTLITLHLLILTLWSMEITSYVYIGTGMGKLLKILALSVHSLPDTELSIWNQQVNFNSNTILSYLIHVETLWKVFYFIFLLENYQLFVLKTQKVHSKNLFLKSHEKI